MSQRCSNNLPILDGWKHPGLKPDLWITKLIRNPILNPKGLLRLLVEIVMPARAPITAPGGRVNISDAVFFSKNVSSVKLLNSGLHPRPGRFGNLTYLNCDSMAETLLNNAMMHSDALISRARQGDQNAQGRLVQLWYKRIYNFSYKFFLDHDLAMEVTQKSFISMCRNLGSLQEVTRFKPWLYKIAVNYCREEARRRKGSKSLSFDVVWSHESDESPRWESSGQRHDNPERQYHQSEMGDILQDALMQLSEEQREVVIMKEYEGFKFREIADALNISENTVKSRMYYGLDSLRKILEKKNINKDTLGYEL